MKRRVWKWWKVVMVGVFVLTLAFVLPAWASGPVGTPGAGSPALRADAGSKSPGGAGNDGGDDQSGGDRAGNGGQDGGDDGGHDDGGHDDGNGAGNGDDDGQHGPGDSAGGDDRDTDDGSDDATGEHYDGEHDDGEHEDSFDGLDVAGYARSLGLAEGFAARVAYQAVRAGVDKEKLAATLRLMAELVQEGYFPDLGQGPDGSVDHEAGGPPSFDELDESTQARLGETLAEVVRTRDREWIRERLMACARAGMTAIEALEALASE